MHKFNLNKYYMLPLCKALCKTQFLPSGCLVSTVARCDKNLKPEEKIYNGLIRKVGQSFKGK